MYAAPKKKKPIDIYGLTTPFNTHGPSLTADMYTFYGATGGPSVSDNCGKKPFPIGFGQKHKDKVKAYNDCKLNFDYNKLNAIKNASFVTYQGKQFSTQQAYDYALSKGFQGTYTVFAAQYATPEVKTKLQNMLDAGQNLETAVAEIAKSNSFGFEKVKQDVLAKELEVIKGRGVVGPQASPTPASSADNIGNGSNAGYWILGGVALATVAVIIYKRVNKVKPV